jgi:hypothetical protein
MHIDWPWCKVTPVVVWFPECKKKKVLFIAVLLFGNKRTLHLITYHQLLYSQNILQCQLKR